MRARFTALIAVMSLTAPLSARAMDPYTTEVEWNCPQTQANGPGSPTIKMTLDPEHQTVDLTEYRAFLDRLARDYPSVDYFSCAQDFMSRSFDRGWSDSPFFRGKVANRDKVNSVVRKLYDEIGKVNTGYGAGSYERGALSPLEPAGTATTELPLRSMRGNLKDHCGAGIDGSYLDYRFLQGLPDAMGSVDEMCKFNITKNYAQVLLDAQLDTHQCQLNPGGCAARRTAIARAVELLDVAGLAPYTKHVSMEAFCGDSADGNLNKMLKLFARAEATASSAAFSPRKASRGTSPETRVLGSVIPATC